MTVSIPNVKVLIDGANFWNLQDSSNMMADLEVLPDALETILCREIQVNHIRMSLLNWYTGVFRNCPAYKIIRVLQRCKKYDIIQQDAKRLADGEVIGGNVDPQIVRHAHRYSWKYDIIVLITGDTKDILIPIVEYICRHHDKMVIALSTLRSLNNDGKKVRAEASRDKITDLKFYYPNFMFLDYIELVEKGDIKLFTKEYKKEVRTNIPYKSKLRSRRNR